jgi:hypothetical protein
MPTILLTILVSLSLAVPANALARKGTRKTATTTPRKAASKPDGVDVLLMGSSSIVGPLGIRIEQSLKREGLSVGKYQKSSSGICRPDFFDWKKVAVEKVTPKPRPKVVVLYLGGNDSQDLKLRPEEQRRMQRKRAWVRFKDERDQWREHYENRMVEVIDGMCDRGVRKVIVLSTVAVAASKHVKQQEVIRELQQKAAERSKCGVFHSTIPPKDRVPPARLARYRAKDGFHVTREGADRVWSWLEEPFLKTVRSAVQ